MIIKEILNRRSVREFGLDEVSEEFLMEIIKAAQFAPSGEGMHGVEFVVIKDLRTKEKIFDITAKEFGQEFIKQAPALIIPICDTNKTEMSVQDLSVASENIFLQATAFGLGSVWKNIDSDKIEEEIKSLLKIPQSYKAINIIPIGYPKTMSERHSDKEFSKNKIHREKF